MFPIATTKISKKVTFKEAEAAFAHSCRDLRPQLGEQCFGAVVSIKRTEKVREKSHDLKMSWKQGERKGASTNIPSKGRPP